MESLYRKAVNAWGLAMPSKIRNLSDRSDESVFTALNEVCGDLFSENWESDSKIAWRLMQGYDAWTSVCVPES